MDKLNSSKSCSIIVQDVLKAVAKLSNLGLLGPGSLNKRCLMVNLHCSGKIYGIKIRHCWRNLIDSIVFLS